MVSSNQSRGPTALPQWYFPHLRDAGGNFFPTECVTLADGGSACTVNRMLILNPMRKDNYEKHEKRSA